jgi:hypothetical protein
MSAYSLTIGDYVKARLLSGAMRALIISSVTLAAAPAVRAADPTISATQRLISQVFSRSRDTARVVAALRTTHDQKDVIKIFDRLEQSDSSDMQVYAMISKVIIKKDPAMLNVGKLLSTDDGQLVGSAVASLIEAKLITDDQLKQLVSDAKDPAIRVLAATELSQRGKLPDQSVLKNFLTSDQKDSVRYYAAITLLGSSDPTNHGVALAALKEMVKDHDERLAAVVGAMVIRVRKEQVTGAAPWVVTVAEDDQQPTDIRLAAVATLLALKQPQGPVELANLVETEAEQDSPSVMEQLKLGLIAFEFADQLSAPQVKGLSKTKSDLVRSVAALARQAIAGNDATPNLVTLMKEGDPVILSWALAYADRASPDRQRAIYLTLINLATVVDDQRGRDFDNAAAAAQKIAESKAPDARQVLAALLKSNNRAVVEATLAGMLRTEDGQTFSDLVQPMWADLNRSAAMESATNDAALILGREGDKEVCAWLSGMVEGGTVQDSGFRVLAGWYYAKLNGETGTLCDQVLASAR